MTETHTATATVRHLENRTELDIPWHPGFLRLLKTTVPHVFRQYNPRNQTWTILHPCRSKAEAIVLSTFPDATVQGTPVTKKREESYDAAQQRASNREEARQRREAKEAADLERSRLEEQLRQERRTRETAESNAKADRERARHAEGEREQAYAKGRRDESSQRPSTAETPDHQLFGIRHDAPKEVMEAAYRALAKKYHPDRGGHPAIMQQINDAYSRLQTLY